MSTAAAPRSTCADRARRALAAIGARRVRGAIAAIGIAAAAGWAGGAAAREARAADPAPSDAARWSPLVTRTITIGPPQGPSPMQRGDGARTGRSVTALPAAPRVLSRLVAPGGIGPDSVVVTGTDVVLATARLPILVDLDCSGDTLRERWIRATGDPVASGPIVAGDGTRVVLTVGGELLGFSPRGALAFHSDLGPLAGSARPPPLPLEDGGSAFVVGGSIFVMDPDGGVRERIRAPSRAASALLSLGRGLSMVDEAGDVFRLGSVLPSRPVGTFGGNVGTGAARVDARTLVAVVDHRRVVDLDLETGATHDRFVVPGASLEARITVDRDGKVYVTTFSGMLIAIDRTGTELWRLALEPGANSPTAPAAGPLTADVIAPSPPPWIDRTGRIAFARPGGRAGVVRPDGSVALLEPTTCASPVALAPSGADRFVLACRDGTVLLVGGS